MTSNDGHQNEGVEVRQSSADRRSAVSLQRGIFILAALVVVLAGIRAAQSIVVPFLLSIFIAVLAAAPIGWLRSKGVPAAAAVGLVTLGVVVVLLAAAALLGTSLANFTRSLPDYVGALNNWVRDVEKALEARGVAVTDAGVREAMNPGAVMRFANSLLSSMGDVLGHAFLIIITVIFILLEASGFPAKLRAMVDEPESSMARIQRMLTSVKRYFGLKTISNLITGVVVGSALAVIGVDFAVLWGALAFFLNYIPNIGSIIAAAPPTLLALVQLGWREAVLVIVICTILNLIMGNVVEPRMMGRGVGLSTLVVFLSLVFWGWMLGPVGMILSVPLTVTIKLAAESHDETRWIAILLGESPKQVREKRGQVI